MWIGRLLGGFRHRVAIILMGVQNWRKMYRSYVSTPLDDVMLVAGLETIETYIYIDQNTVA